MSGNGPWQRKTRFDRPVDDFFNRLQNDPKSLLLAVLVVLVGLALYSSAYTVQPDEEAVVMRFRRYLATTGPGLHFKLPYPVDEVFKVKTGIVHQEVFGSRFKEESRMLTGDLNLADVEWAVLYRISDPQKFLFNIRDPIKNIRDISQATMRRVIGDRTVNDVLTTGRQAISDDAEDLTQQVLDGYDMGISIQSIELKVDFPDPVKPAVNEVNSAKQEQEQAINNAEAAYNKVIPKARGEAEKLVSESEGYATALLNRSTGDADKFKSILASYKQAPEITRTRLYLEVMEELLGRFHAVTIVDPEVKGLVPVFSGIGTGTTSQRARLGSTEHLPSSSQIESQGLFSPEWQKQSADSSRRVQ